MNAVFLPPTSYCSLTPPPTCRRCVALPICRQPQWYRFNFAAFLDTLRVCGLEASDEERAGSLNMCLQVCQLLWAGDTGQPAAGELSQLASGC